MSVPGLHQQRGARGALPPPRGAGRPAADGDPQHQLPLPPRQPRPVRRYICTIISGVPTLLHRYTFINLHNFHLKMGCFYFLYQCKLCSLCLQHSINAKIEELY